LKTNQRTRAPSARTAWTVTGVGVALWALSAILVRLGGTGWDARLYSALNQVPTAAAAVLTPLSRVFLPLDLAIVAVATAIYALVRNRSLLPLVAGAAAAGAAWMVVNLTKLVADRPRPYKVVAGAVLRQHAAHGNSFPSSHTAVAFALALALLPFLPRLLAVAAVVYASLVGWSRVYLGVHYPLDVLAGAGIGMAVGGLTLVVVARLTRDSTEQSGPPCERRRA
jgi:undecaprenyl-diphosphatase